MSVTSGTKRKEGGIAETIRVVFHALVIALVIRTFLFQPFNIPSGSMKATLLVGDYLFVSKYSYGYSQYSLPLSPPLFSGRIPGGWMPERGDVVVFRHNGATYLKRVLAKPGDTVYVLTFPGTGRDEFVMDWESARIRRITTQMRRWYSAKVVPRRVPDGFFYAVGDHVDASVDSREFGPVPMQSVLGRLSNPPDPQPVLSHVTGAFQVSLDQDRS